LAEVATLDPSMLNLSDSWPLVSKLAPSSPDEGPSLLTSVKEEAGEGRAKREGGREGKRGKGERRKEEKVSSGRYDGERGGRTRGRRLNSREESATSKRNRERKSVPSSLPAHNTWHLPQPHFAQTTTTTCRKTRRTVSPERLLSESPLSRPPAVESFPVPEACWGLVEPSPRAELLAPTPEAESTRRRRD
jgi:hypothetical protein